MHRTQQRILLTLAAGATTLVLSASPALAGSDGCAGGDCQDEDTPARVVPVAPAPVSVTPLPAQGGDTAPEQSAPQSSRHLRSRRHVIRGTRTRTVAVVKRTIPRGAVAAGAGGTAPHGGDAVLALLAGGGLVLLATGGGLVASGRRTS
jgi:hypothetical protein